MANTKKTTKTKESLTRDLLITYYMEQVLENGAPPANIYKFCKENKITEDEFYTYFGSFEALEKGVWESFFEHSMRLMHKSKEFEGYSVREKLLGFFYTFFEMLTANRSYVLFALNRYEGPLKNLEQLSILRKKVRSFAKDLVKEENAGKPAVNLKKSGTLFAEATWLQLLFLLRFWKNDNSPKFESTDVAIEKSVNALFDLFDTAPIERVIDLGKFLWKEKMF